MRTRLIRLSGSFLLFLALAASPAGAQTDSQKSARVDSLFAEWNVPGSPGAAVAVLRNGAVVHARGYGYSNLELDVPITTETVFYIGSVGKQFTAYAIVLLESQGKLSFDDDIRTHLPELNDFGETIRIRHLIHHTSGLRDYFALLQLAGTRDGDLITQEHILDVVRRQRELNFPAGTQYSYSNSNYVLLATIVERVTGQTFGEWMKENVFDPLGMSHTTVGDDHEKIIKQRALSYAMTDGGYKTMVFPYSGYGAGGIYTSVSDLVKWVRNFDNPVVGTRQTIQQMYQRGVLNNGDTLSYAFALGISRFRGLRVIGHGGALAGYRAYAGMIPDATFAVIVAANFAGFDAQGRAIAIGEVYLSDRLSPPEVTTPTARPATPAEAEIDPEIFDDFAGKYSLTIMPQQVLTFRRDGNQFFIRVTGQPEFGIFPSSDSTFFLKVVQAEIIFHRDPDGSVNRLTLNQNGSFAATRITPYAPSHDVLNEYVGTYVSPELETTYTLQLKDRNLVARYQRHADIELAPVEKDQFTGSLGFFGRVRFERDDTGVTGFRVSSGRTQNVLFKKQ